MNRWSARVPVELSNRELHARLGSTTASAQGRCRTSEGLCDGPADSSIVDRVMQLQQSHPPILVGAGSRWMLGIAGREANIVCNLPRRCPREDLRELLRRSTPARGPQGRVGRTGGRAPGGDLGPAAGPHRLTVCKSDWQISGKRQLSALKASNRPGTYPA
jgi:hypothetical protein